MTEWFNVGKIVNTHGIRGEVRVISRTDFPDERYAPGNVLFLFKDSAQAPVELTIQTHRKHKNFDLLTFEGYDNVNLVETFKEGMLKISENQLTDLEDNEFYYHEIIGCSVSTDEGKTLGEVNEILSPGANDVWVVKTPEGKELLIPYIESVVKKVDPSSKQIIITVIEGLLE
ncbi:ribosome maturation factor RimM [Jeotgalibacillus proteolyticus]|uniref:Ribosome maturation factor RimM n=1 Tax=Jeotgalibacillus proteolyticus TaxID=2082395 RepID=A0A2S5GGG7_9BACL|nr:ribosome maturation factor RimM [Jeotgalibacillus proteolyticus]PPA72076.1 ribosome maturation factor RimM [Jeotgalibacillus proteolyticus]